MRTENHGNTQPQLSITTLDDGIAIEDGTQVISLAGITDESDRATAIEMSFTMDALRRARELAAPEVHEDFDGEHCVECGDEIPKGRLEHGKVRCIRCQTVLEQQRSGRWIKF